MEAPNASFVCTVCNSSFKFKTNLRRHEKKHAAVPQLPAISGKKHKCSICSSCFSCKSNLNRHMANCHSGCGSSYTCEECGAAFHSKQGRTKHKQSQHPISVTPEAMGNQDTLKAVLPDWPSFKVVKYVQYQAPPQNWFFARLQFPCEDFNSLMKWKDEYEEKNKVDLRILKTFKKDGEIHKVLYRCNHNTQPRKNTQPTKKHTGCTARLSFAVKEKPDGGKNCTVTVRNTHNHISKAASTAKFRRPIKEVVDKFLDMFRSKRTVSQALALHKADLQAEYGEEYYLVVGDRAIVPDPKWAYALYYNVYKKEHGASHGGAMLDSLSTAVKQYNESNSTAACSLEILPGEEFVLAVMSPLMQRISSLKEAGEMMFMDASSNVDRYGCKVFLLMINSVAGGVPVGSLLTTSESENVITTALQSFTALLTDECFGGRGKLGPKIIMTDDSAAERNALSSIFPDATLLLCCFHVLQAAWRYMWDAKTSIRNEHRQELFSFIKCMLYAKTEDELTMTYNNIMKNQLALGYEKFCSYVSKLYRRRGEWAICMRKELITRGQNTNNICEAAVRVLKDKVLERMKAFSPVQLFHYIANDLVHFYETKLLEVASGRPDAYLKRRFNSLTKTSNNFKWEKSVVGPHCCTVINCSSRNSYVVDTEAGLCSCFAGQNGAPCKHQFFLSQQIHHGMAFLLPQTAEQKLKLHYLATGSKKVEPQWYEALQVAEPPPDCDHADQAETLVDDHAQPSQNCANPVSAVHTNDDYNQQEFEVAVEDAKTVFHSILERCSKQPAYFVSGLKALKTSYEKNMRTDASLLSALHCFGKYSGCGTHKRASQSKIGVQPTAIARRKKSLGTRRCLTSGRPAKWQAAPHHNYAMSTGQQSAVLPSKKAKTAAPHNLNYCVHENVSLGKKH